MNEAGFRDYFADHLDLIEPDLDLIDREYRLPNRSGSTGRVDLLARDGAGNLVVIELKKSDASARSALHELLKYLGLIQRELRRPASDVRCVLLSTDWRELLVPFSEQVNTSPFTLEGRQVLLDSDGKPAGTQIVEPLRATEPLVFPATFVWLTFGTLAARDSTADLLCELLPKAGLANIILVRLTSLLPEELTYPFSVILPFFPFSHLEALRLLEQTALPFHLLDDFEELDIETCSLDELREAVQTSLESAISRLEGVGEAQYSNSDELAAERERWNVDGIFRAGPGVKDHRLLTDGDILERLRGTRGTSDTQVALGVEPVHKMQFLEFRTTLGRLLDRYGWWEAIRPMLDAVEGQRDTSIAARAFSPPALLRNFACFLHTSDEEYLPSFRVVIAHPEHVVDIMGRMTWDGETPPPPVDDVLPDLGVSGNVLRLAMSEEHIMAKVLSQYGFVFPTLEQSTGGGDPKVSRPARTMSYWLKAHASEVERLKERLGPITGV